VLDLSFIYPFQLSESINSYAKAETTYFRKCPHAQHLVNLTASYKNATKYCGTLLCNNIQGDPKRCVPIFCSIKNPFF